MTRIQSDEHIYSIIRHMRSLGMKVFENELSVNIVGLRSPERKAGQFDDRIVTFWKEDGALRCIDAAATTDPGLRWLHKPGRSGGTAIMVPGQYRGAYCLGKHRGKYDALVQRGPGAPPKFVRDPDCDGVLDIEELIAAGRTQQVCIGLNIHASTSNPFGSTVDRTETKGDAVGPWSAGCQVFARTEDYREWWEVIQKSANIYGPNFTYTLLDDFRASVNEA